MAAVFFVIGAIALIWSAAKYQIIYHSIVDSFPPQFRDDLSSRYAFPVLVLSPATPLPLQAEYVKSMWGFCVFFLCMSLGSFASRNAVFGSLFLLVFAGAVFKAIKSRKTLQENCNRADNREDREHV
ncbi:hypothetical protein [Bradyrhizobium sp. Tv2a-2]|uniref:hypothetical protein n=1 Tax=Bradyrhizobium sp. Tv2a-2 TaxID=113395 RepID=UPI0004660832|nr:hypothetical protein [Bradyrhizobium sp. Tv2a-2]